MDTDNITMQEEIEEMKSDVMRAVKAAMMSTDYPLMKIILETAKETRNAYDKQDFETALYYNNKGFWYIGMYLSKKLHGYKNVTPEFFKNISSNIADQLKIEKSLAFSEENLKRCFKLVNLAGESWFEDLARRINWEQFAHALDRASSFDELRLVLSL